MTTYIRSVDDAVAILQALLKNTPVEDIQLDASWVQFSLKIYEGDSHSVISTKVMKAFVDYEKRLRHTYALLKYGDPRKKLTTEEKQKLTIVVSVENGCTNHRVESINELLKNFVKILDGMSGNQKFILLLAVAILMGGYFLSDVIQSKEETTRQIAKEVTVRQVVRQALQVSDPSGTIYKDSVEFEKSLNQGLSGADKVSVSGRDIIVPEIKQERKEKDMLHSQMNGDYIVRSLDFTKDSARIKVEYVNTQQEFWANLDNFISNADNQKILLERALAHKPVYIQMNVIYVDNVISDAFATGIK